MPLLGQSDHGASVLSTPSGARCTPSAVVCGCWASRCPKPLADPSWPFPMFKDLPTSATRPVLRPHYTSPPGPRAPPCSLCNDHRACGLGTLGVHGNLNKSLLSHAPFLGQPALPRQLTPTPQAPPHGPGTTQSRSRDQPPSPGSSRYASGILPLTPNGHLQDPTGTGVICEDISAGARDGDTSPRHTHAAL